VTLPGGFDSRNVPMGFQLVGPHLSEEILLRTGHAYQRVTDWHTRHPRLEDIKTTGAVAA
jgi:amidase